MSAARKIKDLPGQELLPFYTIMPVVERLPGVKRGRLAVGTTALPVTLPDGLPADFQVPEHGLDGDAFLRREDGTIVKDKAGKPIKRWGTTKQARKLLAIDDKETLYVLIHAKLITAYKLNTTAMSKNGRFRVDLQSVMAHKLKQMRS